MNFIELFFKFLCDAHACTLMCTTTHSDSGWMIDLRSTAPIFIVFFIFAECTREWMAGVSEREDIHFLFHLTSLRSLNSNNNFLHLFSMLNVIELKTTSFFSFSLTCSYIKLKSEPLRSIKHSQSLNKCAHNKFLLETSNLLSCVVWLKEI